MGLGGEEGAEVREGGADVAAEVENAVVAGDAVGGAAFCCEAYVGHAVPCSLGRRWTGCSMVKHSRQARGPGCVLHGVGGDFYPASFEDNR